MKQPQFRKIVYLVLPSLCIGQQYAQAANFAETDLVSDIPGRAAVTDPNLVNPWGIAFSPTSAFWVSDNGSGVSTLYNGAGVPQSLVVTIPPAGGGTPPSAPTGIVFNGGSGFTLSGAANPARFIFATEDGTISGWNPAANATVAIREVDNGAIYKGLALGNNGSGDLLYAANFHAGTIDVFNNQFIPTTLPGAFTDPTLPAGYAPFDIKSIGGKLYVTYALQDSGAEDDVAGPGHGFVDVFDMNGNFLQRLISGGPLNSPWGMAVAPSGFGPFGNDLLVGNFGDGRINAFDLATGNLVGTLDDANGNPLQIQGLWGLTFGNGGNGGDVDKLYFTAGIAGTGSVEDHGLFGVLAPTVPKVPEGATNTACLLGATLIGLLEAARRSRFFA